MAVGPFKLDVLECLCIRTRLSVAYWADEAVMGEMNGLDSAGGLVVSEGHQGGVINHLRQPRCWCIPGKKSNEENNNSKIRSKVEVPSDKTGTNSAPSLCFLAELCLLDAYGIMIMIFDPIDTQQLSLDSKYCCLTTSHIKYIETSSFLRHLWFSDWTFLSYKLLFLWTVSTESFRFRPFYVIL